MTYTWVEREFFIDNPLVRWWQAEQWLDLSTRAIFIDFVVYSPNVDFVTQVSIAG